LLRYRGDKGDQQMKPRLWTNPNGVNPDMMKNAMNKNGFNGLKNGPKPGMNGMKNGMNGMKNGGPMVNNPPMNGLKNKQPGENLRKPHWDLSTLQNFAKDFYVAHHNVAKR